MTKNIDDGKHAMIFVFTDCWEVIFWRKMPFFVFIDPYRTRPGTGKTCSLHVPPPVEITPKILANFASLNSSIAFGGLRLGGCLRRRLCTSNTEFTPPLVPAEKEMSLYSTVAHFFRLPKLKYAEMSVIIWDIWHKMHQKWEKITHTIN